jgi:hypothetical protein
LRIQMGEPPAMFQIMAHCPLRPWRETLDKA